MIVGGDKLDYPYSTVSSVACIIETKLMANSIISDHTKYISKFCAIDLNDLFQGRQWRKRNIIGYTRYITDKFM